MQHSIIAALLASTVAGAPALATTFEVHPGQSISAALDRAGPGDTVLVKPGTYHESVRFTGSGRPGAPIRLVGEGSPHIIGGANGISAMGGDYKTITGFRISGGENGIQAGGTISNFAKGIEISNNTIVNAGKDGIKLHQMQASDISSNTIERAGSLNNGNGDGGIDMVAVLDSDIEDNRIISTKGHAGIMIKGGSGRNNIEGNDISGVSEGNAITVGGMTDAQFMSPEGRARGAEAFDNTITGNRLSSAKCAFWMKDAKNNTITGNTITGGTCDGLSGQGSGGSGNKVASNDGSNAETNGAGASTGGGSGDYQSDNGGGIILASAGGALGGSCAGSGALSNAMAAAGAVVSIWSGGRATAPLQVAQQMQLVAQRICQTESLMAQIQMLAGMDLRTADDVLAVLYRLEPLMRQGDFLMTDQGISDALAEAYPEAFPEGSRYEDMESQQIIWNERTRSALDRKSQIENNVIQQQRAALARAGRIEQAGRESGGIRGAQLATNALLTELMGSLNNQIAVTTAHQRALAEVQYRQEAERAAAERDNKDFMATLGECPTCGQHSINLFGGAGSGAMGVGSRARTANQVFGTGN
jgi:parallel beta-helix repeat protein